jgi:hypothetical protein
MVAPLAKDIVFYSNGDANVTEAIKVATKGRRVTIEPRRIVSLQRKDPGHPEIIVRFEHGDTRIEAFMVREQYLNPFARILCDLTSVSNRLPPRLRS